MRGGSHSDPGSIGVLALIAEIRFGANTARAVNVLRSKIRWPRRRPLQQRAPGVARMPNFGGRRRGDCGAGRYTVGDSDGPRCNRGREALDVGLRTSWPGSAQAWPQLLVN